jgi:F-type H+-transporting ATPase subunit delta
MTAPEEVRHATVMDDDETRHVARIYAEALFRSVQKANQAEEVLADLEALVKDVFQQDPGLELFFSSAAVGKHRKEEAIKKAFGGRAPEVFVNYLLVLNAHGRLDHLRAIAKAFRTLYDKHTGRVVVHVRSAVPLTDQERERLCQDVRQVGKREPVLDETVDPAILGGLIVRIQDWVYDASVRTRLLSIRDQLIERSSDAITSQRDRFGT